jgi:hypothetical protein
MKSSNKPHLPIPIPIPILNIHKLSLLPGSTAGSHHPNALGAPLTVVDYFLALGGLDAKALVEWVVAGEMAIDHQTPEEMPARSVIDLFEAAHCCFFVAWVSRGFRPRVLAKDESEFVADVCVCDPREIIRLRE